MENHEKETSGSKLNKYLESNRKALIITFVLVVCSIIGFICGSVAGSKAKAKDLMEIDEITFTLTDESENLSEGELDARRFDALDKLTPYTKKISVVGARANMLAAEISYQQAKYEDAAAYWKTAAEKSKKSYIAPLAYFNMASAYEQLNKLEEAANGYKTASEADFVMKTHAKFSYGRILEEQGKYQEAVAVYTELNDEYPNDSWAKLAKTRLITLNVEGKSE